MKTLSTFRNEPAVNVRFGDRVQDSYGRDFIAASDAQENDRTGDIDILTDDLKWVSYNDTDRLSITFEESEEYAAS